MTPVSELEAPQQLVKANVTVTLITERPGHKGPQRGQFQNTSIHLLLPFSNER